MPSSEGHLSANERFNVMKMRSKDACFRLSGAMLLSAILFSAVIERASAQTTNFTASGTWTCPEGVNSATIECWGGGGAGGTATNGIGAAGTNAAAGGGGGAFAESTVALVPGTVYTITVGAGGTAAAGVSSTSTNGGPGGNSWFSNSSPGILVLAAGGAGGGNSTPKAIGSFPITLNGTNGIGGAGSACIGTIKFSGGSGANGTNATGGASPNVTSGGGGGGAGNAANGGNASAGTAGTGGTAGGGTGGAGRVGNGSSNNGNAGTVPGGGGSGGLAAGSTLRTGGAGAAGQVTILYSTNFLFAPKQDVWNGQTNGVNIGNWDSSTTNWMSSGVPANYTNFTTSGYGDMVTFDDTLSGTANINLTTNLSPTSLTVNNNNTNYVFSGSGAISGPAGLTKTGSGTLTVDNSGINNYGGGNLISAGVVQVGNSDANGNLSGPLTNNGALVFDRSNSTLMMTNVISGSGTLANNGSGTVTLSTADTYTGATVVNAGTLALSGSGSINNSESITVSNGVLDVSVLSGLFNYSGSVSLLAGGTLNLGTVLATNRNLTLSNAVLNLSVNANLSTNIVSGTLTTLGTTNVISIASLPNLPSYPAAIMLASYSSENSLVDANNNLLNLSLQLPATGNPAGYLTNLNNSIQLMLLAGPTNGFIQYIAPVSVLTYHNDNARTGQNTNEVILTPANVGSTNFGKLFSQTVDGYVFAQPLVEPNVMIPGKGIHNVLFIATEHDSVYAFDADNNAGANSAPLWHTNFLNPAAGVTTVPAADQSSSEIANEIGITSTPVVDPVTGTIYVEAKTKEVSGDTTNYVHRLHALDITTGAEKFGGPVIIAATVPGIGDTSTNDLSTNGMLSFYPLRHLNRPGLLLLNGVVYIACASLGDKAPYHGWLFGYNAQTLAQTNVFNSTPNGAAGGVWESACGPAADANGNIFVSTGNGTFDATNNYPTNNDYGDSLLKLSTTNGLALADYFTPHDQVMLNSNDLDFGSGGMTLLPDEAGNTTHPHLLVCADKRGTVYLVDRDNLTHFNPSADMVVQELSSNIFKSWGSPAYYGHNIYYIGASQVLESFSMSNAVIGATVISNTTVYGSTGGSPCVSANGSSNAIVWAINVTGKALHAYYATNVATEIGSGQNLGSAVKFTVPTVVNGKVYVGAISNVLVFGLATPSITAEPQSLEVLPGGSATFSVTATSTAPPLQYQWFRNNCALVDQTNATLTLTDVQVTDGGVYSVMVSDAVGSASSVIAVLDLSGITRNADGTMTVEFIGNPGQAYHLETTANLNPPIVWQTLPGSTTNAPPGGVWQFTDPQAPNYQQRFYRSVSP